MLPTSGTFMSLIMACDFVLWLCFFGTMCVCCCVKYLVIFHCMLMCVGQQMLREIVFASICWFSLSWILIWFESIWSRVGFMLPWLCSVCYRLWFPLTTGHHYFVLGEGWGANSCLAELLLQPWTLRSPCSYTCSRDPLHASSSSLGLDDRHLCWELTS
jgi:hypothetical protein